MDQTGSLTNGSLEEISKSNHAKKITVPYLIFQCNRQV